MADVYKIYCSCEALLSERGQYIQVLSNPKIKTYSTDEYPN